MNDLANTLEVNGIRNGDTVEDVVTGFKGIVTGIVVYQTGCHQVLVTTKVNKDGDYKSSWLDVQRVKLKGKIKRVVFKNEETPGFGEQPPIR